MRHFIITLLLILCSNAQAQYIGGTGGGGATNCSAAFAMLPVELLHFTATAKGQEVQLQWATATELNNAGFHVERSADGERFEPIMEVEGMGTSLTLTHYETMDRSPLPGLSYYRLRQTDFDGTVASSQVVAVERGQGTLDAFPNPVEEVLHITGLEPDSRVEIIDPIGRVIMMERSQGAQLTLDAGSWPAGRYAARVISGSGARSIGIIRR
ncbi:MAG TPA: T9SS type A sorting domain-containing protein [Flavobacteriales bacterium]|nr:T9SS type A sorting domain-containing protein [Flavobacteriales bacterium]